MSALTDNDFHSTIPGKTIKLKAFTGKRSSVENVLTYEFNDAVSESDLENSSQYYEVDDFKNAFNSSNHKSINLFHMNINFDQLYTLLSKINITFDVIRITETQLKKQKLRTTNIDINEYNLEHTLREASCGGTLLYVKSELNYISRKDLNIYKKNELESTFIEILASSGKNIIVECICRHPCMHLSEFNDIYLKDLLENLSQESKTIVIMGDFNIDPLKYDTEKDSAGFLESMYASFLLPYIGRPSQVTPRSNIKDGTMSGNIVTTISDHYAQFLVLLNLNKRNPTNSEIYLQDFKKLNKNNLERDLVNTNWDAILEVNNGDVHKSFESFIITVSSIVSEFAPLKKNIR